MKVTHHSDLFGRRNLLRSGAPEAAPGREYPVGTKNFAGLPMKILDRGAVIPGLVG